MTCHNAVHGSDEALRVVLVGVASVHLPFVVVTILLGLVADPDLEYFTLVDIREVEASTSSSPVCLELDIQWCECHGLVGDR